MLEHIRQVKSIGNFLNTNEPGLDTEVGHVCSSIHGIFMKGIIFGSAVLTMPGYSCVHSVPCERIFIILFIHFFFLERYWRVEELKVNNFFGDMKSGSVAVAVKI